MRISRPAVRTLLLTGVLGALALTTTGCDDDKPEPKKPPVVSTPAATPSPSPSPTLPASPSATPSATPTPPATRTPPKPKPAAPSLPPPMDGAGDKGGDSTVYYKNCAAARAAGVTPLHRGDPGYAAHLDRDGDGIACER
ncbi:excalibur calcium-binding domain-containing protein [Streptomyces sp. NPDC001691]|uniref:excalibur calcium-binding domain-containing protein n=1 Tax=Streptomyces sp. NPDC001691 TaxID=3364600 RepID=UPI0036CAE49B